MGYNLAKIQGPYHADILGQPKALEDTVKTFAVSKELAAIVKRLKAGEFSRILLTGMGASYHALHPVYIRLTAEGFSVVMAETSELIHYEPRLIAKDTLVVAVSQSGESAEIVRLLDLNKAGATVIGLTNEPKSTLAKRADCCIFTYAGSEFSVSCKTFVTALAALEWLGAVLCGENLEPVCAELSKAAGLVAEYLKDWQAHTLELAEVLKGVHHVFVVGRGPSLPVVGDGALLMKESCRFHAEGMSSASFRHGPFEMLNKEMFVLVLSGNEKTAALNAGLYRDIKKHNAKCALSDGKSDMKAFRLPHAPARLLPIMEILLPQMMSLALGLLADREPGRFEQATKVTTIE